MALGGIKFVASNGNIGFLKSEITDPYCGLLFDIGTAATFWAKPENTGCADKLKNTVVELNSSDDLAALGAAEGDAEKLMGGLVAYHVRHFFKRIGGTGRLFLMLADCSSSWSALQTLQLSSGGVCNQIGIWTAQSLWGQGEGDTYELRLVEDLQGQANTLADDFAVPAVLILNANTYKLNGGEAAAAGKIDIKKIPSCVTGANRVAIVLGQAATSEVAALQKSLDDSFVGNIGAVLGAVANVGVGQSMGWTAVNEMQAYFPSVDMGFSATGSVPGTMWESLSLKQLDNLDDLGYNYLTKYPGIEGRVYISKDRTCAEDDYRTVSRNRVMNKSHRLVRRALLPLVNSPITVGTDGTLTTAQISALDTMVRDALAPMVGSDISAISAVTIPAAQNILQNDKLFMSYRLIPLGTASEIEVNTGFVLRSE